MTQKRKRRTKAEILAAKSDGLGDSLELPNRNGIQILRQLL